MMASFQSGMNRGRRDAERVIPDSGSSTAGDAVTSEISATGRRKSRAPGKEKQ